ncbi:MAG: hypothetical protein IT529_09595 [Burkholderiales bacterium]|nr:hypothetical protein [Burkholderiales bacterium]
MATIVRKQRVASGPRLLRKPLKGRFVEILDLQCEDRKLVLIKARSRAIRRIRAMSSSSSPRPGNDPSQGKCRAHRRLSCG